MPLKINVKSLMMYAAYAAAVTFINCAVRGVPLSLGLCFSMLLCGTNIIATPVIYVISSAVEVDLITSMLALAAASFLTVIVFLYRRTGRKLKFESALYIIIALAPYVIFAEWQGIELDVSEYVLKAVAAGATGLFTVFCFKSVYALLFRLYRCRLREDELVCIAVVFTAAGVGLYSLAGETFYLCVSAAGIVFFTRLMRSPANLFAALVLSLPHAIVKFTPEPLTAYVIISVAALLFSGAGRLAPSFSTALLCAGYMYICGCFEVEIPLIVTYSLLLFFACFLPAMPRDERLKEVKLRLLCERILPETAVARSRKRTGEKLYRISELFREIECAFMTLDETVDETAVRGRMLTQLKDRCCRNCDRAKRCEKTVVYSGFRRLIDAGCLKGRVNLIDLPSEVTAICTKPSDVLGQLNAVLAEYRRFMTENENARSGRKLLADQSRGVAEVMKSCAVDLSRAESDFSASEEGLKKALSSRGISCPEVEINGESGEVSAVLCGKFDVRAVADTVTETLGRRYVIKDKLAYDGQKTCLIFCAPPKLDAAFGVAYAVKKGEKVSGDTHSVIRINEHAFLMALSDGMGSGEYAKKISEAAISLIEAFYRAEMPEDTVLKTINKLLSFNRDERFACIDIAAVNLETGRADFVKIGSPAGIIVREGEIRVLESQSLPLGILENLKPTVCSEMLKSGDIVVFMSDGITSSFPSATDMYEYLQGLKPLNPQSLADKILAGALERAGHTVSDDMTVVCTRLFDNG